MAYQLVALFVLLGAALAGLKFLDALIRRPSLMAAWLIPALLIDSVAKLPPLDVGPFSVFVTDVLVTLAIAASAARLLRLDERLSWIQTLMLLATGVGFYSLLRGIAQYGPQTPVVSARGSVFFLVLAVYFSTARPTEELLENIRKYWVYGALGLSAMAVLRWVAGAAGVGSPAILQPGGNESRVLDVIQAMFIAQGFFMALPAIKQGRESRRMIAISGWLLAVTVLLEHRTVWVVVIACLGVFAFRDRELRQRLAMLLLATTAVGGLLALTVFSGTEGGAAESLSDSATDTGTWEWRVQGWRILLEDARDLELKETLVGEPLGKPFEREVNTRVVSSQPHNYYVQVLLRLGGIGLGMLLLVYALLFKRLGDLSRASSTTSPLNINVLIVLLASHLLFFMTYAPSIEQGILLGLAVAVASRKSEAIAAEVPDPTPLTVLRGA